MAKLRNMSEENDKMLLPNMGREPTTLRLRVTDKPNKYRNEDVDLDEQRFYDIRRLRRLSPEAPQAWGFVPASSSPSPAS